MIDSAFVVSVYRDRIAATERPWMWAVTVNGSVVARAKDRLGCITYFEASASGYEALQSYVNRRAENAIEDCELVLAGEIPDVDGGELSPAAAGRILRAAFSSDADEGLAAAAASGVDAGERRWVPEPQSAQEGPP